MARRVFGRNQSALRQGQRRKTLWIGGVVTNNVIAVNSVTRLTTLNAAALALRPFTIIRTRGIINGASDQETTSENYFATYGNIVVTDEASAAGIGSLPTPEAESGSDWHVYEQIMGAVAVSSAIGVWEAGISKVIDSKAMRKVDLGEDLVSIVEVGATGSSEGMLFRQFVRVLVKLH